MTIEDRLVRAFRSLREQETASPEAWTAIQKGAARRKQKTLAARIGLVAAPLVALAGIGVGTTEVLAPAGPSVHVDMRPGPTTTDTPPTSPPARPVTTPKTTPVTTAPAPTTTTPPTVPPTTPAPTTQAAPTTPAPTTPAPTTAAIATTAPPAPTPTTTVAPATTVAPNTIPPPPSTAAQTGAISGTVVDGSGRPVAAAYVIGLDSLAVVRTDASGQFTMSCQVPPNGDSGNRGEPLVASTWLLPVQPAGQGTENTIQYGPPPTAAGLGYAFSGGAPDAASASAVSCGGPPAHLVLGAGGGADVEFQTASGAPLPNDPQQAPVDNLYLPGLGSNAALETAPLSGNHQIVQQLGAGTLYIDGTTSTLSCQGAGVAPDPGRAGADVTITPGVTSQVVCTTT